VSDAELVLPSAGPDPLPVDTALAAVLGYARGRRPLYFRAPNARTGRWVELPAFGYERFDRRPGRSVSPTSSSPRACTAASTRRAGRP